MSGFLWIRGIDGFPAATRRSWLSGSTRLSENNNHSNILLSRVCNHIVGKNLKYYLHLDIISICYYIKKIHFTQYSKTECETKVVIMVQSFPMSQGSNLVIYLTYIINLISIQIWNVTYIISIQNQNEKLFVNFKLL